MKHLFSIGHSNVEGEQLVKDLQDHRIELLVDVRSRPYSRFCPQFNRKSISSSLNGAGIAYHFLGDKLGGIREENECDSKGFPVPELVFQSPDWIEGIAELLTMAEEKRTAVMCSERDFRKCHRHFLIEKYLSRGEWRMDHIDARSGDLW